eukprot:gb/GEZN01005721.1/.p1 GENE.gb/GEZN01005721.1/~~gb/GEZN01005721.1/.p1  ORF type:complete len:423 (+),score=95.31 gb/GEZN01005721.1/:388-1656(+)
MALKLYKAGAEYADSRSVQIAAIYAGLQLDVADSKDSKEYKTLAAYDNAPVLNTPMGPISGDLAILRYVARCRQDSGLYGQSFYESGLVDQWLDFNSSALEPAAQVWILPVKGLLAWDGRAYAQSKQDVAASLKALDAIFLKQTYLVGERVTIADIAMAVTLTDLMIEVMDANFRKPFPNLCRWFETVVNQVPCMEVLGKVEMCKQEKQAPKPAKQPKEKGDNQQQQQGKEKQQQQPKKEKAPEQQQEQPKKEEKPKNPILELPKSSMSLDSEKKQLFLKKPLNSDFFKEVWSRYDHEGYSCFISYYNYNKDNTGPYFMACNAIGGFLQRCDGVRKYALGVMNLIAKDEDTPPWEFIGAWMFRGPIVPQEMMDNPDAEYYTWKKLDMHKPEDRELWRQQWEAGKLPMTDGKPGEVLERRYFK